MSVGEGAPHHRGPRVTIAADAAELAPLAARLLAAALIEAQAEWRAATARSAARLTVALAGGTTPRDTYRALARDAHVPWSALAVLPGDERALRPAHADSNLRLLRETLVVPGALRPEQLHAPFAVDAALTADGSVTDAECKAALARLRSWLTAPLDLLLLGLGADGHVASLFPGSTALAERAPVALVDDGPSPHRRRLTLTPPALREARRVFVLAAGAAKAPAVAAALQGRGPVEACPARLVADAHWLLDRAAAAGLDPARHPFP